MKNSNKWYKRNPLDFINGTMKLSLEEAGAYSYILDLIYLNGEPLEEDIRYLAGVLNISTRKWVAIRDRLILAGKITVKDGFIYNARAQKELEDMRVSSQERRESGSKGGQKRVENSRNEAETSVKQSRNEAENEGEFNKNNNLAQAELKHTRVKDKGLA